MKTHLCAIFCPTTGGSRLSEIYFKFVLLTVHIDIELYELVRRNLLLFFIIFIILLYIIIFYYYLNYII